MEGMAGDDSSEHMMQGESPNWNKVVGRKAECQQTNSRLDGWMGWWSIVEAEGVKYGNARGLEETDSHQEQICCQQKDSS